MSGAWDEFEHDPRQGHNAPLRASDQDRDVVQRQLVDAYAAGKLSRSEYDVRLDQVLAVRTLGQIPALLDDLTPSSTVATASATFEDLALQSYLRERRNAIWRFLSVSTICWVIWLAVNGTQGGFPWPLFVMLGTALQAARIIYLRDDLIAQEKGSLQKRERKEMERERRSLEPPVDDA